jgi:hypothetical protein
MKRVNQIRLNKKLKIKRSRRNNNDDHVNDSENSSLFNLIKSDILLIY